MHAHDTLEDMDQPPFETLYFGHIAVQIQLREMTEANMRAHLAAQTIALWP